jgi:hypothetical protein
MKRSRFQKGSGAFRCEMCKRLTRAVDENGELRLCPDCLALAYTENEISDYGSTPAREQKAARLRAKIANKKETKMNTKSKTKSKMAPASVPAKKQKTVVAKKSNTKFSIPTALRAKLDKKTTVWNKQHPGAAGRFTWFVVGEMTPVDAMRCAVCKTKYRDGRATRMLPSGKTVCGSRCHTAVVQSTVASVRKLLVASK